MGEGRDLLKLLRSLIFYLLIFQQIAVITRQVLLQFLQVLNLHH